MQANKSFFGDFLIYYLKNNYKKIIKYIYLFFSLNLFKFNLVSWWHSFRIIIKLTYKIHVITRVYVVIFHFLIHLKKWCVLSWMFCTIFLLHFYCKIEKNFPHIFLFSRAFIFFLVLGLNIVSLKGGFLDRIFRACVHW